MSTFMAWQMQTSLPPFPPPRRPESWQPLYWSSGARASDIPPVMGGPGNQGTSALQMYYQAGTNHTQTQVPRDLALQTSNTGTLAGEPPPPWPGPFEPWTTTDGPWWGDWTPYDG